MEEVQLDNHSDTSAQVSSIGTEGAHKERFPGLAANEGVMSGSLHDHHHWGDLPRFPGEKSMTSSVGVERDDRSTDDEAAVEVGEVTEEHLDEEAATELVLVQEQANGTVDHQSGEGGGSSSAAQPDSKQGSVAGEAVGLGIGGEGKSSEFELQQPSSAKPSENEGGWGTGGSLDLEEVLLGEEEAGNAGLQHWRNSGGSQEQQAPPEHSAHGPSDGPSDSPSDSQAAGDSQPPANSFDAVNAAAVAVPAATAEGAGGSGSTSPAAAQQQQQEAAALQYQSRMMQQLTSEDDLTVYTSSDMDAASKAANGMLRNPTVGLTAAAAPGAAGGAAVERFEIDVGAAPTQPPSAIEAAAEQQAVDDIWEKTFKGLLYVDGVDALGRPVVVINADAVPHNMKSSALVYCKMHLEPVVNKGQYVLVFTARKARLPSMWIMGAYRTLPRPYRKNVQYIILVRPSGFLRAVLAFMRPFVSRKAGRKIKQVDNLGEIGEATGGEVTLQHLGARFVAEVASQE